MSNLKKYAVIVAGGKGTRMGGDIPKQFKQLLSMPVLCYAIQAFAHAIPDINIVLVVPATQLDSAITIVKSYLGQLNVITVAGGETRYHSVQNGLNAIGNDGIVFVHDAVRPLVSQELIMRCYSQALAYGSAIPVLPVADSMRLVDDAGGSVSLNRERMRLVQTPQTFMTNIILPAFRKEYDPRFTDEATVVESMGVKVHLVDGDRDNIKITNPGDMVIADTLLKASV